MSLSCSDDHITPTVKTSNKILAVKYVSIVETRKVDILLALMFGENP